MLTFALPVPGLIEVSKLTIISGGAVMLHLVYNNLLQLLSLYLSPKNRKDVYKKIKKILRVVTFLEYCRNSAVSQDFWNCIRLAPMNRKALWVVLCSEISLGSSANQRAGMSAVLTSLLKDRHKGRFICLQSTIVLQN